MKYEYKTFTLTLFSAKTICRSDETLEALNELGEDGWEVCSTLYESGLTSILLLKKRIEIK